MFQFKWVWHNLKGYRGKFIAGMVLEILGSSTAFLNAVLVSYIVDACLTKGKMEHFIPALSAVVIVHILRMSAYYIMIVLLELSSQGMLINIRNRLYDTLQSQDVSFYNRYRTGDLMTRMTGDLDMVRHFVSYMLKELVGDVVLIVGTVIYLLSVNVQLTLILVAISPMILVIRAVFSKKARPIYAALREKLAGLNDFAQENIEANRVVKAFANEGFEKEKFRQKNEDFRQSNLKASYTWLKFWPGLEFISQSFNVITLLAGGIFVINGNITLGQLFAFTSLTWALSDPMRMLGMLLNDLERFFTSANKVIELFYSKTIVANRHDCVKCDKPFAGNIEFKNVKFCYGKNTVLDDINFSVTAGETVAIMGATGSGKTTLMGLIARFFDVKSGCVSIDGVDVRDYDMETLRSNIGMATQDVFLFSDTVDGNIAYGDLELPEEEIHAFAYRADASSFIERMPEGYDTIIGERGVGLSGGQRQRIALARALAIKPSILVLDDTTSAVDMETEKFIQQQLRELPFSCTKFIIAQRVSSVKDADKIIILDAGKIVEMGTHDELLAHNGYYKQIFDLQNSGVDAFESAAAKAGDIRG